MSESKLTKFVMELSNKRELTLTLQEAEEVLSILQPLLEDKSITVCPPVWPTRVYPWYSSRYSLGVMYCTSEAKDTADVRSA